MKHDTLKLLLEKDDITWKALLYELVKSEDMNPWDIDISHLTLKYVETIKEMQKMDFRVSGKVLLAAAILLKMKSTHLLEHDVDALDRLLASSAEQEGMEDFFSEFSHELFKVAEDMDYEEPRLIPRTPQPRHRKITIYDLASALQKALEVKKRKLARIHPDIKVHIPHKKFDITQVIRDIYSKIKTFLYKNQKSSLTFSRLLPQDATKEDKAYTFIPLLHLDNQRKIDLMQTQHFGDIGIELGRAKKQVDKELNLN